MIEMNDSVKASEEVLIFSKKIWVAIQKRDIKFLKEHTYLETVFVHMGANINRDDELEVIRSEKIIYKEIEFEETEVRRMPSVTIVLTKMKLKAEVGGNEVINPFMVTEVYTGDFHDLRLASVTFTKIIY